MPKSLEAKIEAILFFKSEPVTVAELSKLLGESRENLQLAISNLQKGYEGRGMTLISNGEEYSLGTAPEYSELIEQVQKEEFSRELGRAGLETLAIVLYRGPVSRREIDLIRGVNSSFILRSLLVRGLVEREDSGRGFTYKPTLKLLQHLGIKNLESLPEYGETIKNVKTFLASQPKDEE